MGTLTVIISLLKRQKLNDRLNISWKYNGGKDKSGVLFDDVGHVSSDVSQNAP